ncbi:MAG: serine protease [Planctomycetaceae bacterium]
MLTCFHVVQSYVSPEKRREISVQFDYFDSEQIDPTDWINTDPNWDIPISKYSVEEDVNKDDGDPSEEFLDYALLKLASDVETFRKPYAISANAPLPPKDDPILIVGHPGPTELQKMKVSFAAPGFEKECSNGSRFVYRASTEKGSSGSPVFSRDFELIGMHHNRGQINRSDTRLYKNNRGIPIALIAKALGRSNIETAPDSGDSDQKKVQGESHGTVSIDLESNNASSANGPVADLNYLRIALVILSAVVALGFLAFLLIPSLWPQRDGEITVEEVRYALPHHFEPGSGLLQNFNLLSTDEKNQLFFVKSGKLAVNSLGHYEVSISEQGEEWAVYGAFAGSDGKHFQGELVTTPTALTDNKVISIQKHGTKQIGDDERIVLLICVVSRKELELPEVSIRAIQ